MSSYAERQIPAVGRALCDRSPQLRGAGLWGDDGPTEKGLQLRIDGGEPEWDATACTLWSLAWAIYDHAQTPDLWEILELGTEDLQAVGSLLYAFSRGEVSLDTWLSTEAALLAARSAA